MSAFSRGKPRSRKRCKVTGAAGVVAAVVAWLVPAPSLSAAQPDARGQRAVIRLSKPMSEFYLTKWLPLLLYLRDSALLVPESHGPVLELAQEHGLITGLTSAPCGDLVIYALTNATGSELMGITTAAQQSGPFADAAAIGEDAWFHDPMSLSPDRRWLVATVSPRRREMLAARAAASAEASDSFAAYPGEVWLIGCGKTTAPRRIASDSHMSYCSWAPSGRLAVCELTPRASDATEPKAILLDAESGETKPLTEGRAHALWSEDSRNLRLFAAAGDGQEELDFEVSAEGSASLRSKRVLNWEFPKDALWSHDATIGAYVWGRDGRTGVSLVDTSGSTGQVEFKPGVRRLLDWSCRGELLACLGGDGCLHFSVGAVSTASYERLVSIAPNPPGASPSFREGCAMETSKSPVSLMSAAPAAAWAESGSGPCLLYVDSSGKGEQSIYKLCFGRKSLRDFGLDPSGNLREQIIVRGSLSNLSQVKARLFLYALEHGGRLPPHATGKELLKDLTPYLKPADLREIMSSPYGGGKIRVVLLLPGQNLNDLKPEDRSKIPMAELWSDDGHLFVAYANGSVKQVY